jgi:hypothetical protein
MPRPPLVLFDVLAPVPVAPGFTLAPGETVALRLGSADPITIARAWPHYLAGGLLLPLEDGQLRARDDGATARARAALRGWRVG